MPALGRPPLDLLPLAPPAGPLRTRAAAAAGAPPAPDAECDSTDGGATHSGLGTGSARLGSRPPQPGAGSGEVGRPQGLGEHASEYRAQEFNHALADLGVKHIYIRAGRPTSNGCVERVQQTLLEECWKPAFARYLTPKYTGLQRDLVRELHIYNTDRAHQGRRTRGLTPEHALTDRNLWL